MAVRNTIIMQKYLFRIMDEFNDIVEYLDNLSFTDKNVAWQSESDDYIISLTVGPDSYNISISTSNMFKSSIQTGYFTIGLSSINRGQDSLSVCVGVDSVSYYTALHNFNEIQVQDIDGDSFKLRYPILEEEYFLRSIESELLPISDYDKFNKYLNYNYMKSFRLGSDISNPSIVANNLESLFNDKNEISKIKFDIKLFLHTYRKV